MNKVANKILFGTDLKEFKAKYPSQEMHKVLDNATIYVTGKNDEILLITSKEWESRLAEIG